MFQKIRSALITLIAAIIPFTAHSQELNEDVAQQMEPDLSALSQSVQPEGPERPQSETSAMPVYFTGNDEGFVSVFGACTQDRYAVGVQYVIGAPDHRSVNTLLALHGAEETDQVMSSLRAIYEMSVRQVIQELPRIHVDVASRKLQLGMYAIRQNVETVFNHNAAEFDWPEHVDLSQFESDFRIMPMLPTNNGPNERFCPNV